MNDQPGFTGPATPLMDKDAFQARITRTLAQRAEAHQLRQRLVAEPIDATHVRIGDKVFTNFCSNNYLGLTHHPAMISAAGRLASSLGVGAGAAGLLGGYSPEHQQAEQEIAAWKGFESAVLLPSGYQANLAAVQTLAAIAEAGDEPSAASPSPSASTAGSTSTSPSAVTSRSASTEAGGSDRQPIRFIADKLVHASLLDAVAQTHYPLRIFPHNHFAKLQRLLTGAPAGQLQVVLTESIFSMDGDAADLPGLMDLKKRAGFVLLVDEAHGTGVFGDQGAGLCSDHPWRGLVDVSIATLSKAMGVVGGAICSSRAFCDAVVNAGRAYIYSTATPAMQAGLIRQAISIIRDEPARRQRLHDHARRLRSAVMQMGMKVPEGISPIIPVILGDETRALSASKSFRDMGLLVMAVRPPTVPPGSSRLRITVSSEHTEMEIDQLIEGLRQISQPA